MNQYAEKQEIKSSKFTGNILITFKTQLMAKNCIDKYRKPNTFTKLLRNIGCSSEEPI